MFDQTYTTPEGYTLARPLILPDAGAFSDVLEHLGEWDHQTMSHHAGRPPVAEPEARYLVADNAGSRLVEDLSDLAGLRTITRRKGNTVGPFCTVDARQIGGPAHRSIAVRATDATMEALAGRIVTPDDTLSFQVIVHQRDDMPPRALVIAQHGYIIGSHWLAYVDPDTLPAYPLAARDAAVSELGDRIRAATAWVPWRRDLPGGAFDYGYDGWYPGADTSKTLQRRGSLPHTRPVVVANIDATGRTTYYPEGLAHLVELETAAGEGR